MLATKKTESGTKITVDTVGLQELLGCGRMAALEIGERAGAKIKIGRRTLWSVRKIMDFIDSVAE